MAKRKTKNKPRKSELKISIDEGSVNLSGTTAFVTDAIAVNVPWIFERGIAKLVAKGHTREEVIRDAIAQIDEYKAKQKKAKRFLTKPARRKP